MTPLPRYATLIDGAFAIRKLATQCRAFPTAADVEAMAAAIARDECLSGLSRLRVYFYHARPAMQALTHSVEAVVVVTGDSDLIPAFKFARREGVRVFLCHLGHGIKRDLQAHADRIIRIDMSAVASGQSPCRPSVVHDSGFSPDPLPLTPPTITA